MACPLCAALAGDNCVVTTGRLAGEPAGTLHNERLRAADRAARSISSAAQEFLHETLECEWSKLVDYVLVNDPDEFVPMAALMDEIADRCGLGGDSYADMAHRMLDDERSRGPEPDRLYEYGGHGVDISIDSPSSPSDVYWSPGFNSFVLVRNEENGCWLTAAGQRCDLVSVNGRGEIRWHVTNNNWDEGAIEHFKLRRNG